MNERERRLFYSEVRSFSFELLYSTYSIYFRPRYVVNKFQLSQWKWDIFRALSIGHESLGFIKTRTLINEMNKPVTNSPWGESPGQVWLSWVKRCGRLSTARHTHKETNTLTAGGYSATSNACHRQSSYIQSDSVSNHTLSAWSKLHCIRESALSETNSFTSTHVSDAAILYEWILATL